MPKHYHFIGIGGIGMGKIASLLLAKGETVSGSDVLENSMVRNLQELGAKVFIGHHQQNIKDAQVVVYSSAVRADNPEMIAARQNNIPIFKRAQLLSQLMDNHIGITVAGAHGKTTTTSMISNLLVEAGLNPTIAVGGIMQGVSNQSPLGDGKYFVAEADESDGSFLFYKPFYSVITNIDFEHVDYYQNWDNILGAYRKFIGQTDPRGKVIVCGEDERLMKVVSDSGRDHMTYGFSKDFDISADNVRTQGGLTRFDCFAKEQYLGAIKLLVPGRHNVLNALACVCIGRNLSLDFSVIEKCFMSYQGVHRRFQMKGRVKDVVVFDDYGHHPTEIQATLQTAKSLEQKRLVTVFQPHRYTRTKLLFDDFVKSLLASDVLIITDIYAASEPALEGVSSEALCACIKKEGHSDCVYLQKERIPEHLQRIIKPGDMVLTLGAGDVYSLGEKFLEILNLREENKSTPL